MCLVNDKGKSYYINIKNILLIKPGSRTLLLDIIKKVSSSTFPKKLSN